MWHVIFSSATASEKQQKEYFLGKRSHIPTTSIGDFYNGYESAGENLRGTVLCSKETQREANATAYGKERKVNNGTYGGK